MTDLGLEEEVAQKMGQKFLQWIASLNGKTPSTWSDRSAMITDAFFAGFQAGYDTHQDMLIDTIKEIQRDKE